MFQEGIDYYIIKVNGVEKMVLTGEFLLKRGSCCGSRCKHCPYIPSHTKGNKIFKKVNQNNNS